MLKEFKKWLKGERKKALQPVYWSGHRFASRWDLSSHNNTFNNLVAYTSNGVIQAIGSEATTAQQDQKMDERIEKKPVEVFLELTAETPVLNMADLDGQIKMVQRRFDVLKDLSANTQDEEEALGFLKARKASQKNKPNFVWPVTTFPMVEALLKKYKLGMVNFESYSRNVPMEAIDELEHFIREYEKVTDEKPVLKLIIDETPAPKETVSRERKKDPILLASSPFGRYFYVLGAWDKEVQIVDDLIYNGK